MVVCRERGKTIYEKLSSRVKITEEEAKETINNAKSFVEVVERLIEKLETERCEAEK